MSLGIDKENLRLCTFYSRLTVVDLNALRLTDFKNSLCLLKL